MVLPYLRVFLYSQVKEIFYLILGYLVSDSIFRSKLYIYIYIYIYIYANK
jgi:hypothetical protein